MPVYCDPKKAPPPRLQLPKLDAAQRVWREPGADEKRAREDKPSRDEDLPKVACGGSYL